MEFEADEVGLHSWGSWPAAEVVFTGGEEDGWRGDGLAGGEVSGPGLVFLLTCNLACLLACLLACSLACLLACRTQLFDGDAAEDCATLLRCANQEGFIEDVAGERQGRERESGLDHAVADGEAQDLDLGGAQGGGINAGMVEVGDGFGTQEFAADFVVRGFFLFDEEGFAAGGRETDGGHGAG